MRSLLRAGVLTLVATLGSGVIGAPMVAQETSVVDPALKSRVERRFRVLQVREGLVLTPRREVRGLQSIEIREGVIAVDGTPTSGAQLRERLGADADLVLQVSYLSAEALAAWAAPLPPPPPPPPPSGWLRRIRRQRGEQAARRGAAVRRCTGARVLRRSISAAASSSAKTNS